ncbi:hypothetical protein F0Q53_01380 [Anaplasma marginale]|uniref:Uncharacterized protein n=2 Tax=Anaplasma marginale TaxID=770 RepID=B9KH19_ANAMF|nr:hypothetical protein AM1189 [Anaplasma marginale str. St. Maries]ACM49723.1 Hypothetical protein AMF_898 [Anaplasma marginale str. Florida]AXW84397.1 hypothetical protein CQZ76_04565 [Anaplasma marginale]AXW85325.1 hypothetical protein BKM88_04555 [Anaplasma marginale]KAA8472935.1 hypothetical protein F0Q58_01545 [Anaplasma marginale]
MHVCAVRRRTYYDSKAPYTPYKIFAVAEVPTATFRRHQYHQRSVGALGLMTALSSIYGCGCGITGLASFGVDAPKA